MTKNLIFILFGFFHVFFVKAQELKYNCFFQTNSAEYSADSLVGLQKWLNSTQNIATINIDLTAYTDSLGTVDYNDLLATKRINTIAQILMSKGYQISNYKTIGKRYTTENYSSHSALRRVEIELVTEERINDPQELDLNPEKKGINLKINHQKPKKPEVTDFEKIGNNVIINLNIEFRSNSDVYKDEKSAKQVYYLAEYLKKNPNKKVMILGHVCCSNNYAVSNIRAKKVYDDLRKYKINKNRMKYKGMSNKSPLVKETNSRAEQQNRRVEVMFYE